MKTIAVIVTIISTFAFANVSFFGCGVGFVAAADLDDPVSRPVATVRAEIERGMSAAPNPLRYNILNYDDAVVAVLDYNKQRYTETDAFQFGVYYRAWHELWRLVSDGFYRHGSEAQLARVEARIDFILARALQKRLGLSDAQVKEVANPWYVDGQETFEQMAEGSPACGACKLRGTYPDRLEEARKARKSK